LPWSTSLSAENELSLAAGLAGWSRQAAEG